VPGRRQVDGIHVQDGDTAYLAFGAGFASGLADVRVVGDIGHHHREVNFPGLQGPDACD